MERHRSLDALRDAPLFTFTDHELDAYLKSLSSESLSLPGRVARLARKNIGQPYRLFLLGEFPYELHDADPLYCLSASDCVTFVEHTYAMALAHDWPSFFRTLQRIRYKKGAIGMLTRNHFTEADWNVNNAWLFEDVTEAVANGETRRIIVSVDRARFFAKYGLGQDIPVQRFETSYMTRASLPRCVSNLRTGDVIEIVRGTDDAPYVSHMGLCLRAGAECLLIHSAKPTVREEGLLDYVKRHENVKGVKVLRVREEAQR